MLFMEQMANKECLWPCIVAYMLFVLLSDT